MNADKEFANIDGNAGVLILEENSSNHHFESQRVSVKGKFFFVGDKKFYVKGVTYGAFEPDEDDNEYFDLDKIEFDFALMASYGINTVRIPHTTPPRSLLDIAHKYRLKVMIGLSAEQYVGYLIDKKDAPDIDQLIRDKLKEVIGHPALLCIAIGNEIPAAVVRWIGRKKVERYIKRIFEVVKSEDPDAIVTYVNYPTTEYLQLPFLDLLCFNVYLEDKTALESYLTRLQNIAGDRPLILSEVGLDSIRNGELRQAEMLDWQIRTSFNFGACGVFIFSWTDEWFRGGEEVYDWAFGITDKSRTPKPALEAVTSAFSAIPFGTESRLPMISVAVCTHNGQRTIRQCLEGISRLEYSNYEVIIINDGSTDNTLNIINEFPFKVISIEKGGLSNARNLAMEMAGGEIITYLDDDAFPDPHWLDYLAYAFETTDYAAIGGPNILPQDANIISECVDHTPGTPTHVLLTDIEAEHIPGCNMAFRLDNLKAICGFDVRFRTAGDDVDLCWRIQHAGWKIGFCGAAVVWHHRRNTVKGFWKQQVGYGKAEALLERKWPEKYNAFGHRTWGGRIYGNGILPAFLFRKWRIYHGVWGSAPFQSIYEPGNGGLLAFTLMPEWYILSACLFVISMFGMFWQPLLLLVPFTFLVIALPIVHIVNCVRQFRPTDFYNRKWFYKIRFRFITIFLHVIQPLARLIGRFRYNLTPWRRFSKRRFGPFYKKIISVWCESWVSPVVRLESLESDLRTRNTYLRRGGDFDTWDIWLKGGAFGGVRIQMAAEDHAVGKQYLRFRIIPHWSSLTKFLLFFLIIFVTASVLDRSWYSTITFCSISFLFLVRVISDCAIASGCSIEAMKKQTEIIETQEVSEEELQENMVEY